MKLKDINLKNIFVLFASAFIIVSCESYFEDTDNADPNAPLSVPINVALPSIELALIDSKGGVYSNFNTMFIQHVEGIERQWESFNKYDIQPVRFNQPWTQIYEKVFIELKAVSKEATDDGLNHYLGIAKTLEAYTLMMVTDVFGDIPYTEAGLGQENSSPIYDSQNTVLYPAIRTLLTDALTLFDSSAGALTPGSDDVIYSGNIAKWKLAAHSILARYYLHLGDNPNALAEAKMGFASRGDNMGFTYPGSGNDAPWYGFNTEREGDLEFHPTLRSIMQGLNDTDRLGVLDVTFNASHPYFTNNQREDLISYREMQFIIAETSNNPVEQHTAYLNGIRASFEEIGLSTTEYDAYVAQTSVNPGTENLTMNHIMTQKYIGMFVQPEAFSDWRRTGIPSLTPVTGTSIPRRWYYPENEYLFNNNAPGRDDDLLFKRVGWDN